MIQKEPNDPDEIVVDPMEQLTIVERQKDPVRQKIAMRLTYAMISITLIPIIAAAVFPDRALAIRDVAVSIIPAVAGIYGTIIGFYFGEKRN